MQVVILCGGTGTRLREQTDLIPKSLIPIGGLPMIVHIMRIYAHYGFTEFVLALGYKQEVFKMYFANYDIINNDITVDIGCYRGKNRHSYADKNWRVTLANTGENTMKGGRLKRVEKYIKGDTFMCTYGDGVADIDIRRLLAFHQAHGKLATVTGVHPIPRFGEIHTGNDGQVCKFSEKPDGDSLVNGGFFVFNRGVFDYLHEDEWCDLELGPLELIAERGELMVYHHEGMWRCMDTLRDVGELQQMWDKGEALWRVW